MIYRLLKTIHSKKYGVDQICFTHHTSSVVYSSKNGWDGKCHFFNGCTCFHYAMI